MHFLKPHYDTEGPFGLPMKDAQAQALEAIIKTLPQPAEPKFVTLDKAPSELLPGERADAAADRAQAAKQAVCPVCHHAPCRCELGGEG